MTKMRCLGCGRYVVYRPLFPGDPDNRYWCPIVNDFVVIKEEGRA